MIDLEQERYESVPEFIREPYPDRSSRGKRVSPMGGIFRRSNNQKSKRTNGQKKIDSTWPEPYAEPYAESYANSNAEPYTKSYTEPNTKPNTSQYTDSYAKPYADRNLGADKDLELDDTTVPAHVRVHPKSPELEALWPGVDHDFLHVSQRGPNFYLTIGIALGAVFSILGTWVCARLLPSQVSSIAAMKSKNSVVTTVTATSAIRSRQSGKSRGGSAEVTTVIPTGPDAELVVPVFSSYEVKSGDTLASIAGKAYHRVSPRLLDAICKVNGMRSADVLTLGQKITLPEYRPRINQSMSDSIQ